MASLKWSPGTEASLAAVPAQHNSCPFLCCLSRPGLPVPTLLSPSPSPLSFLSPRILPVAQLAHPVSALASNLLGEQVLPCPVATRSHSQVETTSYRTASLSGSVGASGPVLDTCPIASHQAGFTAPWAWVRKQVCGTENKTSPYLLPATAPSSQVSGARGDQFHLSFPNHPSEEQLGRASVLPRGVGPKVTVLTLGSRGSLGSH